MRVHLARQQRRPGLSVRRAPGDQEEGQLVAERLLEEQPDVAVDGVRRRVPDRAHDGRRGRQARVGQRPPGQVGGRGGSGSGDGGRVRGGHSAGAATGGRGRRDGGGPVGEGQRQAEHGRGAGRDTGEQHGGTATAAPVHLGPYPVVEVGRGRCGRGGQRLQSRLDPLLELRAHRTPPWSACPAGTPATSPATASVAASDGSPIAVRSCPRPREVSRLTLPTEQLRVCAVSCSLSPR